MTAIRTTICIYFSGEGVDKAGEEQGMKTLKEIIRRYMAVISLIVMVVILAIIGSIEIFNEQKRAVDSATQIFHQIGGHAQGIIKIRDGV